MATRKKKQAARASSTVSARPRTDLGRPPGRSRATGLGVSASEIGPAPSKGKPRMRGDVGRRDRLDETLRRTGGVSGPTPAAARSVREGVPRVRDPLRPLGIEISASEMLELVAEAFAELQDLSASTESSEAERAILARGGFERMPHPTGKDDPLVQTAAAFAAIRRASLSVAELAKLLGVNESRVRQRLGEEPPSLFGFKHGGAWRIPEFLLNGAELVPGVDKVCARLAGGLHPVAFYRWFTTPNPDLVDEGGEEEALAPRSWLLAGHDPEPVARLAEEL